MSLLASFPVVASLSTVKAANELPSNNSFAVESPDKKVHIVFGLFEKSDKKSVPCYSVFYRGKSLVHQASLGFDLAPAGPLNSNFRIVKVARAQRDETYAVIRGRQASRATITARQSFRLRSNQSRIGDWT